MKGKLSTLAFVLFLSGLILSGCGTNTAQPTEVPAVTLTEVAAEATSMGEPTGAPAAAPTEVAVEAPDVIRGSGNVITEDRPVSDFNRVSLIGSGELVITQGEEESLTVEADDNLMRYVRAEVENGTLIIFTDDTKHNGIQPTKPIKFNLSVQEIVGLVAIGAADISAENINTDRLEITLNGATNVSIGSLNAGELVVRLNGAGNVELAGQVVEQNTSLNGWGTYRAAKLDSQTAIVELNGVGSATVWARGILDVQILGPGNVNYYGEPKVTKSISIVGKLTTLGDP